MSIINRSHSKSADQKAITMKSNKRQTETVFTVIKILKALPSYWEEWFG